MIDNSQDKGFIEIYIQERSNECYLCKRSFQEQQGERFPVCYENGTIFIDYGTKQEMIGQYDTTPGPYGATVYHHPSNRPIGLVGNEIISFMSNEEGSQAKATPLNTKCLAYYTKNGSITGICATPYWGFFEGSVIGGAAAFVAIFYAFEFKSVFRDYFIMGKAAFDKKYPSSESISFSQPSEAYDLGSTQEENPEPVSATCEAVEEVTATHHIESAKALLKQNAYGNGKEAADKLQEALSLSLGITSPTQKDLAERRDIYRWLGYVERIIGSKEQAYEYYKQGYPIYESNDEDLIYKYLSMHNDLRGKTVYSIAFCQAVEDIYHNALDKITNFEHKVQIMRWTVREKCGIYKKPRDIAGAKNIQELMLKFAVAQEIGQLNCEINIRKLCNDNDHSISAAEHYMKQQADYEDRHSASSYTSTSAKQYTSTYYNSSWSKFFPLSYGTLSWGEVLGRIFVYWLANMIVGSIVTGMLGGFAVPSLIIGIYCILGSITTVVAHIKNL